MGFGTTVCRAIWLLFEILLALRETLFKSECFLFKINIPIFHHSIIPSTTQKFAAQRGFIFFNYSEKFGGVYLLSFGDKRKSPFNALPV
jgi:hypothetical protein